METILEASYDQQAQNIARLRELHAKLEAQTGKGSYKAPLSATYSAETNEELLKLARDGLRWRMYWHVLLDDGAAFDGCAADEILKNIDLTLRDL